MTGRTWCKPAVYSDRTIHQIRSHGGFDQRGGAFLFTSTYAPIPDRNKNHPRQKRFYQMLFARLFVGPWSRLRTNSRTKANNHIARMYIFKGDVTCACTFPIVVDFLSSATLVCRKTDSFNVLCLLLSSSCTVSSKLQHFSSCTFSSDLQQSLEPSKLQPKLISSPIQLQQCITAKSGSGMLSRL